MILVVEAAHVGQRVEQEVRLDLRLQDLQPRFGHLALERGAIDFRPLHRLDARHFAPIELADDRQHAAEKRVSGHT